jgi:hypothetical protein
MLRSNVRMVAAEWLLGRSTAVVEIPPAIARLAFDGISVKTTFRDPHLEFDLPASAISRATPNPYSAPGPVQNVGIIGDRAVAVHVFNPPPEGGTSNTVHQLVLPR